MLSGSDGCQGFPSMFGWCLSLFGVALFCILLFIG